MKKKLFVLFLLSLFSKGILSQDFQLGLCFNPHISWFNSDNKKIIENDGMPVGFSYGLMGDFNFTNNYSFSTGIYQIIYNGKAKDTLSKKYKLQYLEIPLTLKMKTEEFGQWAYFGRFGLSSTLNIAASINDNKASDEIDFFNLYFIIGGGIHYAIGVKSAIMAGLTFHNGILRTHDTETFTLKSNFISLDMGILF
jgi:hypothetical protein